MYQLETRKYWEDPHLPIQFEFRNPQTPFPLHVHDFHELVLVYSGRATHLTANGNSDIQAGDFLNVKLGQAHGYKNLNNLILMNILIQPSFFENDSFGLCSVPAFKTLFDQEAENDTGKSPIIHFRLNYEIFRSARDLVEKARSEFSEHSEGYRAMVVSCIQELVILLMRYYKRKNEHQSDAAMDVITLINYVKYHYRSPLSMTALTEISGMSESNILRTFKRHLNCSPFQYISELRLSGAADELIQTDKPITQIGLDFGYNDSNYFARLFKKSRGYSPREYRKKYLKENLL